MFRSATGAMVVSVAALLMLGSFSSSAQADEINLTGKWSSDDGGTYYLRQIGTTVWWLGKSGNDGQDWTNVLQGSMRGRELIGNWADVPQGGCMGSGTLTLELRFEHGQVVEIHKQRQVGDGFGGCVWRRQE